MVSVKLILVVLAFVTVSYANYSALNVLQDMYYNCVKDLSITSNCVKPKALKWLSSVTDKPTIKITEDLILVRKNSSEEQRSSNSDVFENFENFLQTYNLVAKVPEILKINGPWRSLVSRSFDQEDITVPLATTGRSSKLVKKVIVPFLLGLKFKTAVLVPLALALIALKTWKALTLGLLSMVLTGAMLIFKFTKPKVVNYEVIHYPHHHEHHVEPAPWESTSSHAYGRKLTSEEIAYNAYLK